MTLTTPTAPPLPHAYEQLLRVAPGFAELAPGQALSLPAPGVTTPARLTAHGGHSAMLALTLLPPADPIEPRDHTPASPIDLVVDLHERTVCAWRSHLPLDSLPLLDQLDAASGGPIPAAP